MDRTVNGSQGQRRLNEDDRFGVVRFVLHDRSDFAAVFKKEDGYCSPDLPDAE